MSSDDDYVMLSGDDQESDFDDDSDKNPYSEPKATEEEIRVWLEPTPFDKLGSEYQKHLASHLTGTGEWITSTDVYQDWLTSQTNALIWIKGSPGSGKSVLTACIINRLRMENIPVLYFFFRQIIKSNHEPIALLRDWLVQLLPHSPWLRRRLGKRIEERELLESLSLDDLLQDLRSALVHQKRVFCVVDALDEMDYGNDAFLRALANVAKWRPAHIKLLITSRPVTTVEIPLRQAPKLELRLEAKHVDADIRAYVEHRLKDSSLSAADQEQIGHLIVTRASSIFIFAKLALDAFTEPDANVNAVISRLPADTGAMYARLLRQHAQRSGVPDDQQLCILRWATGATRPLRLLEMADALKCTYLRQTGHNLGHIKNLVRLACGPLLELLPDEKISVVHHSLTEYLRNPNRSVMSGADSDAFPVLESGPSQCELALDCLRYILAQPLDDVTLPELTTQRSQPRRRNLPEQTERTKHLRLSFPFLEYAAKNWFAHAAQAEKSGVDLTVIHQLIDNLLSDPLRFRLWTELAFPLKGSVPPLHIISWCGLASYTTILLQRDPDAINRRDSASDSAMHWAAREGHTHVAEALLRQAGCDPNLEGHLGHRALHDAASHGHAGVTKVLLAAGVSPLTPKTKENGIRRCGNAPRTIGHSPLMYACHRGHVDVVTECIPYLDPKEIGFAFSWAVEQGSIEVLRLLIGRSDLDVEEERSALTTACANRDVDLMSLLLERSVELHTESADPPDEAKPRVTPALKRKRRIIRVPPLMSCYCGHLDWSHPGRNHLERRQQTKLRLIQGFKLLTQYGCSVHERDENGDMPIHYVCRGYNNRDSAVLLECLLKAGADPNAVDHRGYPPIFTCTQAEQLRLLLQNGADVHSRQNLANENVLLHRLSHFCDPIEILSQFINADSVLFANSHGNTALHVAFKNYHQTEELSVLRALLSAGANPNHRNHAGETPLHSAMKQGQKMHAKLMIESGADLEIRDHSGLTVLGHCLGLPDSEQPHFTRNKDSPETPPWKILNQDFGARIDCVDYDGRNLLFHLLALDQFGERAEDLKAQGVNPRAVDFRGNNLFHELALRARKSHKSPLDSLEAVVSKLQKWEVDANLRNHKGQTPLHLLASSGSVPRKVMQKFLILAENVDVPDHDGVTALHLASTVSELAVHDLLAAGADATRATHERLTPLHLAARARECNVLGLLLSHLREYSQLAEHIDDRDQEQRTPLHHASRSGRPESVAMLLNHGASVALEDVFDKTALQACGEFEEEQSLWQSGPYEADSPLIAAGLKLCDGTRPSREIPSRDQRVSVDRQGRGQEEIDRQSLRIDEIVKMLLNHGASATAKNNFDIAVYEQAIGDAIPEYPYIKSVFEYVKSAACDDDPGSHAYSSFSSRLSDQLWAAPSNALQPATDLTSQHYKDELFYTLLVSRQYNLLVEASYKGYFEVTSSIKWPIAGPTYLHVLVDFGFTDLARALCTRENIAKLEKEDFIEAAKAGPNHRYMPLLVQACRRSLCNLEVIRILVLEARIDVNAQEQKREYKGNGYHMLKFNSALHELARATSWWHIEGLKLLLEAGADTEVQDHNGDTPLHRALEKGSKRYRLLDTVKLLVEHGANVNAINAAGDTCLAKAGSNREAINLLMRHGAMVTPDALFTAIDRGDTGLLQIFLTNGASPNARRPGLDVQPKRLPRRLGEKYIDHAEWPLLLYACAYNHPVLRGKPHQSFQHDQDNADPLRKEGVALVKLLLEHGADPFATFLVSSTVHTSRSECDWDEMNDLENESNLLTVSTGHTLLHYAIEQNLIVEPFFELPELNIETRGPQDRTLLLAACASVCGPDSPMAVPNSGNSRSEPGPNTTTVVRVLLRLCADLSVVDVHNQNALHLMMTKNSGVYWSSLQLLAARLPSLVDQRDEQGLTPFHVALKQGNIGVAKLLLAAGADILIPSSEGETVLHLLAPYCHIRLATSPDVPTLASELDDLESDMSMSDSSEDNPSSTVPSNIVNDNVRHYTPNAALRLFTTLLPRLDINKPNNAGLTPLASFISHVRFPLLMKWDLVRRDHPTHAEVLIGTLRHLRSLDADPSLTFGNAMTLLHLLAQRHIPIPIPHEVEASRDVVRDVWRFLVDEWGLDPLQEDAQLRTAWDVASASDSPVLGVREKGTTASG